MIQKLLSSVRPMHTEQGTISLMFQPQYEQKHSHLLLCQGYICVHTFIKCNLFFLSLFLSHTHARASESRQEGVTSETALYETYIS